MSFYCQSSFEFFFTYLLIQDKLTELSIQKHVYTKMKDDYYTLPLRRLTYEASLKTPEEGIHVQRHSCLRACVFVCIMEVMLLYVIT